MSNFYVSERSSGKGFRNSCFDSKGKSYLVHSKLEINIFFTSWPSNFHQPKITCKNTTHFATKNIHQLSFCGIMFSINVVCKNIVTAGSVGDAMVTFDKPQKISSHMNERWAGQWINRFLDDRQRSLFCDTVRLVSLWMLRLARSKWHGNFLTLLKF